MTAPLDKKNLPADFGKMPANYDFSTKKFNWKEYDNDYLLRTDAVWEKEKLKTYFLNYMKVFYFDKTLKKYQFWEPEDIYTIMFEGWALEDIYGYDGYSPTGRTNSFQVGSGPKQRVITSVQTEAIQQDYYTLCALRFERWFRCDLVYYDERDKYDYNADPKTYRHYPCYRHFYEAQYACTDDFFDFLMELAYAKQANDTFEEDWSNRELTAVPTVYDTPNKAGRKTKVY